MTSRTRLFARPVAVATVLATAALAACTSSVPSPPRTTPPTTALSTPPPTLPSTTPVTPSTPATHLHSHRSPSTSVAPAPRTGGHRPAPRTHTRTTSPAPSSTAVAAPPACANGTVAVSVREEGALPGEELAQLRFRNRSGNPCTLTGFPGVELLRHGHVLGKPAARSSKASRTFVVWRGRIMTAKLIDYSSCNAPLSDTVGVYVPNQTVQQRVPLQMRGCSLRIDPIRPLHGAH